MIERLGVEAVTGRRQLYSYELRRLMLAEQVVALYHDRARSINWAAWATDNPQGAGLLAGLDAMVNKDG